MCDRFRHTPHPHTVSFHKKKLFFLAVGSRVLLAEILFQLLLFTLGGELIRQVLVHDVHLCRNCWRYEEGEERISGVQSYCWGMFIA